jgi:hypothetical protein
MNYIVFHTQTYKVPAPAEEVKQRLKFIATRRFEDYNIDLIGSLAADGHFRFTNKFERFKNRWVEDREAYLTGALAENSAGTQIQVKIRPNKVLLFLFSFFSLLLLLEIGTREELIPLDYKDKISILTICLLVCLVLIGWVNYRMKKRFEQLMKLK